MKLLSILFISCVTALGPSEPGYFIDKVIAENSPVSLSGMEMVNGDTLLIKNDSTYVSPLCSEEMARNFKDFTVTSGTIYTQSTGNVPFPKILPFNKTVLYTNRDGKITHELEVRRINLADILYIYIKKINDSILLYNSDTVTFYPGRVTVNTRYGYACLGFKYQNTRSNIYRIITIGEGDCNFINFSYIDYKKSGPNSYDQILPLKKAGSQEPYSGYLEAMVQKMGEYQAEYLLQGESRNRQKYGALYQEFKSLIHEIGLEGTPADLKQDTMLTDMAVYYLPDSVVSDLRVLGIDFRQRVPPDAVQEVGPEEFHSLRGRICYNLVGEVTSNRFETLYFDENYNYRDGSYKYIPGFEEYHPVEEISDFTHFQDYEISLIPDYGFEGIAHIITVWQKDQDKYSLKYILDRQLHSAIGYVCIDTVLAIDNSRNLFIGRTFGGDAGDAWGSVWVGVWQIPRSLKVVYEKHWLQTQDDYSEIDYSMLNRKKMIVTEKNFKVEWRNYQIEKLDSTVTEETLLIDSLLTKDHINYPY